MLCKKHKNVRIYKKNTIYIKTRLHYATEWLYKPTELQNIKKLKNNILLFIFQKKSCIFARYYKNKQL